MCRVLGVNRSSIYKLRSKKRLEKVRKQEEILQLIYGQWLASKKRYGAPKIHQKIKEDGFEISLRTVGRYMEKLSIRSIVVKKYRPATSKGKIEERVNILKGDFTSNRANEKWCTDITYIYTQEDGWTYLASVLDICSRKIIGYAYDKRMTTDLAIQAVKNALFNVTNPKGIIIHSDLGSQYTSKEFSDFIASNGLIHSFSGKGNPYHNAPIESFHGILKKVEVYQKTYRNFQMAKLALFQFIEGWYNRKRIHSTIGWMTPQQAHDLKTAS